METDSLPQSEFKIKKSPVTNNTISKTTPLNDFCHCGLSAILLSERFPTSGNDIQRGLTYELLSNYLAAGQRSVKSVILACPESFCIKKRFPASGNDKQNKTIISINRPSRDFLIKISEFLNFNFLILIFTFHF
jgi:hypothetical protein